MRYWFVFQAFCFAGVGLLALFNNLEEIGVILLGAGALSIGFAGRSDKL